jgi:hypothetical protein
MFYVVTDVQPEIPPEVTRKMRKSFENPPLLRLPAWQAADYPMSRIGSDQAEVSKQKITKETKILLCPN